MPNPPDLSADISSSILISRTTIKNIWVDPVTALVVRKIIDVYIDREDPDKYFMDIE